MSKFCKTCIFWGKDVFDRAGDKFGECTEDDVMDEIEKDKLDTDPDQSAVFTYEYFGCIHWRERGNMIVDIDVKKLSEDNDREHI